MKIRSHKFLAALVLEIGLCATLPSNLDSFQFVKVLGDNPYESTLETGESTILKIWISNPKGKLRAQVQFPPDFQIGTYSKEIEKPENSSILFVPLSLPPMVPAGTYPLSVDIQDNEKQEKFTYTIKVPESRKIVAETSSLPSFFLFDEVYELDLHLKNEGNVVQTFIPGIRVTPWTEVEQSQTPITLEPGQSTISTIKLKSKLKSGMNEAEYLLNLYVYPDIKNKRKNSLHLSVPVYPGPNTKIPSYTIPSKLSLIGNFKGSQQDHAYEMKGKGPLSKGSEHYIDYLLRWHSKFRAKQGSAVKELKLGYRNSKLDCFLGDGSFSHDELISSNFSGRGIKTSVKADKWTFKGFEAAKHDNTTDSIDSTNYVAGYGLSYEITDHLKLFSENEQYRDLTTYTTLYNQHSLGLIYHTKKLYFLLGGCYQPSHKSSYVYSNSSETELTPIDFGAFYKARLRYKYNDLTRVDLSYQQGTPKIQGTLTDSRQFRINLAKSMRKKEAPYTLQYSWTVQNPIWDPNRAAPISQSFSLKLPPWFKSESVQIFESIETFRKKDHVKINEADQKYESIISQADIKFHPRASFSYKWDLSKTYSYFTGLKRNWINNQTFKLLVNSPFFSSYSLSYYRGLSKSSPSSISHAWTLGTNWNFYDRFQFELNHSRNIQEGIQTKLFSGTLSWMISSELSLDISSRISIPSSQFGSKEYEYALNLNYLFGLPIPQSRPYGFIQGQVLTDPDTEINYPSIVQVGRLQARTDNKGYFKSGRVNPGLQPVQVIDIQKGLVHSELPPLKVTVENKRTSTQDIRLVKESIVTVYIEEKVWERDYPDLDKLKVLSTHPANGVAVILENIDTKEIRYGKTDIFGSVTIKGVRPGKWKVTPSDKSINSRGFNLSSKVEVVDIKPGDTVQVNYSFEKKPKKFKRI